MLRKRSFRTASRTLRSILITVSLSLCDHSIVSANPSGYTVVNGTVTFSNPNPATLNITNTPGAIINWQQFGINAGELTHFQQQSISSAVLNRVVGQNPSDILGSLTSNGRVFLVNPNGVYFGEGSVIDTAGLIASTLNISDQNFLNNHLKFEDLANASEILNKGFIHTSNAGEVVLVAPDVTNEGVIDVEDGTLLLAAGQSVTLSSMSLDNIEFSVQAPTNNAINLGQLLSDGGSIGVFAGSITNSGTISANAITVDAAGNIVLSASGDITLNQNSVVTASSQWGKGGDVTITAHSSDTNDEAVLLQNGEIHADGLYGGKVSISVDRALTSSTISAKGIFNGGKVTLHASSRVISTKSSKIITNGGFGSGGSIDISAGEQILTSATYTSKGLHGGKINVLSPGKISLAGAQLNASGYVGGGFQGGEGLITSQQTLVNESTLLDASAKLAGNGGTAVVWSDGDTYFTGNISVRAGMVVGNGGLAEVSSKGAFVYGGDVDRIAPNGNAGTLFLDPININVTASGATVLSFIELVDPTIASFDGFGGAFAPSQFNTTFSVLPLTNGNTFVTNPTDNGGTGAVYLFDGAGAMMSVLTGSASTHQVGDGGTTLVGAGNNAVITSSQWNGTVGAWTFIDGTTGEIGSNGSGVFMGSVSNLNSLIGSAAGDSTGATVTRLLTGDYVVALPFWDIAGGPADVGSVTVGSGNGGSIGTIGGATNSIFGTTAGDNIGTTITISQNFLNGDNFMVSSPVWDNTTIVDAGIAFIVDGATGQFLIGGGTGAVSANNGLFGDMVNDNVSSAGVYTVGSSGGDFVVASPNVDYPSLAVDGGAATFVDGATGFIGGTGQGTATPGSGNSLIGNTSNARVGIDGVVTLSDGDYVVASSRWNGDAGTAVDMGAVTWASGPVTVAVSSANSITGQAANDDVGDIVVALTNGNFLVGSSSYNGNRGAFSIGSGIDGSFVVTPGSFGAITNLNSLFGANASDFIGNFGSTIVALSNGNVVIGSPNWANGPATGAGAVTLINGATGEIASQSLLIAASPGATNSIIGTTAFDNVGADVIDLGNNNFAILSSNWTGAISGIGAVTLADGTNGTFIVNAPDTYGAVSLTNSFTGSTTSDLSEAKLFALGNGNFIVAAPGWDDFTQGIANVGAVVFVDGITGEVGGSGGSTGSIANSNSLVGSTANDNISAVSIDGFNIIVTVLSNGDYVIGSPEFDDAVNTNIDAGAITVGSGTTGLKGTLNTTNSIIGPNALDQFGAGNFLETFDGSGKFIAHNPFASSGGQTGNGRVLIVDPNATVTNINYADSTGSSLNISDVAVSNALTGGNLILQASYDFTLQAGADITGSAGNALTIQAGHSIILNANIITNNGNLNLIANDNEPNGVNLADYAAGETAAGGPSNATIDLSSSIINTGTGFFEIDMNSGFNSVGNRPGGNILLGNVTASHIRITLNALEAGASILHPVGTVTADSLFIDHDGTGSGAIPGGGSIGTSLVPLNIVVDNISAHQHSASTGMFITATPRTGGTVTVGNTCFANGVCATHFIQGLETLIGGNINLSVSGDLSLFDPILTVGGGNILLTANNVSLTSPNADIDSSGAMTVIASGDFNNTVAAMSVTGATNITAVNIFLNATGIADLTGSSTVTLNASGQISNFGATGSFADVTGTTVTLNAANGIELDLDADTLAATNNTSGLIRIFETGTTLLNVSVLDNFATSGGGIELHVDNGSVSTVNNTTLTTSSGNFLITAKDGATTTSSIFATLGSITINGNSDGDNIGNVAIQSSIVTNTLQAIGITLSGANVTFASGGPGASLLVDAQVGLLDIDSTSGSGLGTRLLGSPSNNAPITLRGASVDILSASGFLMNGNSGANSSVSIQSTSSTVSINAGSISLLNSGAGTDTDVFISANNGLANASIIGTCLTCLAVTDPAGTAGSQFGIWAANFLAGGAVTFDNDNGNFLWDDPLNWSSDLLPVSGDNVSISLQGSAIILGTGTHTINSLVNQEAISVTGGTLTVNTTATFNGSYNQSGGTVTINGTANFNSVSLTGSSSVDLFLNGINNTISALTMTSQTFIPILEGPNDVTVSGLFTWDGGEIAGGMALLLNGGVNITNVAGNSRIDTAIVTLAAGQTATVNDDLVIDGSGSFINFGTYDIQSDVNIQSSDNTGSFDNRATGIFTKSGLTGTSNIGNNTGLTFITSGEMNANSGTITVNTTNPMQWNGGTWKQGAGNYFINTTLDIGGTGIKTLDGFTLVVASPVNITGDGDLDLINIATLQVGGLLTHSSNANIVSTVGGLGRINLTVGNIVKTAGTTLISSQFINGNQVDIQGGTLIMADPTFRVDNGLYTINGGNFQVSTNRDFSNISMTTGILRVDNGTTMGLTSGGTFTADNIVLTGGATINGTDNVVVNGTFDWINGTFNPASLFIGVTGIMNISDPGVVLDNTFSNLGQVNILNGGIVQLTVGNSYNGGFNIASGGALDIFDGIHTFSSAITGNGTLKVSSITSVLDLAVNSNAGDLQMTNGLIQGAGDLSLSGLSNWSGGSMATGGMTNFNGGVNITGIVGSDRTINVNGGSINNSTINDPGNGSFKIIGSVFNVLGNSAIVSGLSIVAGTLDVAGVLDVSTSPSVGVSNDGGTLAGSGTIIGPVFNNALMTPGTSPGQMTIQGDLTLLSNSVLSLDIAGTTPVTEYDVLIVTGTITFAGAIGIVVDTTSYFGSLQDNFNLISYSNSAGQFTQVSQTQGYTFDPTFGPNGLSVVTTSAPGVNTPSPANDIVNLINSTNVTRIKSLIRRHRRNKNADDEPDKDKFAKTMVCG